MRLICVLFFCTNALVFARANPNDVSVEQRLKPIGQLNVADTQPAVGTAQAGKTIYDKHCIVCHQDGLAGAPKFKNKEDWQPRILKETIDGLVATSIKGINAMPVKGTCNECSDNDMKQAILYMLPRS